MPTKVPDTDPKFTKDDWCDFQKSYCKSAKNCTEKAKLEYDKKKNGH